MLSDRVGLCDVKLASVRLFLSHELCFFAEDAKRSYGNGGEGHISYCIVFCVVPLFGLVRKGSSSLVFFRCLTLTICDNL